MASMDLKCVAISTIGAIVEWVDLKYLTAENGQLIVLLYSLFSSLELRVQACDCLIDIVSRKGSMGSMGATACYRRMFLELLSGQSLQGIQNVIKYVIHRVLCDDDASV